MCNVWDVCVWGVCVYGVCVWCVCMVCVYGVCVCVCVRARAHTCVLLICAWVYVCHYGYVKPTLPQMNGVNYSLIVGNWNSLCGDCLSALVSVYRKTFKVS